MALGAFTRSSVVMRSIGRSARDICNAILHRVGWTSRTPGGTVRIGVQRRVRDPGRGNGEGLADADLRSGLDQASLCGGDHGLKSGVHAERGEQIGDVVPDSPASQPELGGRASAPRAGAELRAVAVSGAAQWSTRSLGWTARELFGTGVPCHKTQLCRLAEEMRPHLVRDQARPRVLRVAPVDRTSRRARAARRPSPATGFFQALVENSPETIFPIDLGTEDSILRWCRRSYHSGGSSGSTGRLDPARRGALPGGVRGGDASSPRGSELLDDDLDAGRDRDADDRADEPEERSEGQNADEHGEA
jgi:hypothetical protein